MGYWKEKQMEWLQRGYKSIDTYVCHNCFGDYALKDYIKANGEKNKCDYCKGIRICAPLEDVIGKIIEGAKREYEDANDCMFYDSAEGGFHGASTYDSYDFVFEVLNEEMQVEDSKLLNDICNVLEDAIVWCEKDPYALRQHQEEYYDWQDFCKRVCNIKKPSYDIALMESPYLTKLCDYIEELGLITSLKKDVGFYRARGHMTGLLYNSAKDIGSAPDKFASENRMSEKGKSMFYGASDKKTALLEINFKNFGATTVAKFYPTKALKVVDFTKLESIQFPSLFDDDNFNKRSPIIFFRNFTDDLSKPINKSIRKEYRPTQVVTAFLENIYQFDGDKNIDGIIYNSSKEKGTKCCALFFDNDHCTDDPKERIKKLWMDKSSIVRN